MSARFRAVLRQELSSNLRRPLFWIWILLLGLLAFGLSRGGVRISSGEAEVGGTKAWITSEYGVAFVLALLVPAAYGFFVAVVAGMAVIQDEELRVSEFLHATRLRPGEYIWAKFTAALISCLAVLVLHVGLTILFQHAQTGAEAEQYIGPFALVHYLRPALVFALPPIVFLAGLAFALGTWTQRPILVFAFPLVFVLACIFFLWEWSPPHLDPRIDFALQMLDPFGWRWLNENYVKGDRGVAFYNRTAIEVTAAFAVQRALVALLGCAAVAFARRRFEGRLRGRFKTRHVELADQRWESSVALARQAAHGPLSALGATRLEPRFLRSFLQCARIELAELYRQPGLWLFVPWIVIEAVGMSFAQHDGFGAQPLLTSGMLATSMAPILTLFLCLLLLFYTVESLRREDGTRVGALVFSSPVPNAAFVFGKASANACVALLTLALALLGAFLASRYQASQVGQSIPFALEPFVVVWGACLAPTLIGWTAFVALLFTLTRNRYTTYALALAALSWSGYELIVDGASWVGNWALWNVLMWTDMGRFELIQRELLLNRALALALALSFAVLAIRHYPRREADALQAWMRLAPRELLRSAPRVVLLLAAPIGLGLCLHALVAAGFQGDRAERRAKDYWRRNVATWTDSKPADIQSAELLVEIDPPSRGFRTRGHYVLVNREAQPMRQIALTRGSGWTDMHWSLNGAAVEPEDRAGLMIFTPPSPLDPMATLSVGFDHRGRVPAGATKNGGGAAEFILPSGVVLTSFGASFAPVVGYQEDIGLDDDNRYDAKEWPADHHLGRTRSAFGTGAPYPLRITIQGPAEFQWNSVGELIEETVEEGRRTSVWQTDHPVSFFNVVGARWETLRGEGTAIYHHAEHRYNLEEMRLALDAARRHYSEWFQPFPWKELKLSEFPALATYAQGFPTNVTFSEGIGFLAKSTPEANEAFLVTAHEAAHQWWGNLLVPGEGPGGNVLSEGLAHFASILLFEAVRGEEERMHFCRTIETRYEENRQRDAERSLARVDGSRPGDTTVFYDKGGMVFWMLLRHMGREPCLAGLRSFLAAWGTSEDHALVEDFVAHMRAFAPDGPAFDSFTRQWFFEVVVPEYELTDVALEEHAGIAGPVWEVHARVTNKGGAEMPVEVAAVLGERFPAASTDEQESASAEPHGAGYHEARTRTILGPGASSEISIVCDFVPARLVVDPDVLVLQLARKQALERF